MVVIRRTDCLTVYQTPGTGIGYTRDSSLLGEFLEISFVAFECFGFIPDAENLDRLDGIAFFDFVDDILAFDHAPKDGMFAIQMGSLLMGDEELAPVGIGPSVGHGENAGLIMFER